MIYPKYKKNMVVFGVVSKGNPMSVKNISLSIRIVIQFLSQKQMIKVQLVLTMNVKFQIKIHASITISTTFTTSKLTQLRMKGDSLSLKVSSSSISEDRRCIYFDDINFTLQVRGVIVELQSLFQQYIAYNSPTRQVPPKRVIYSYSSFLNEPLYLQSIGDQVYQFKFSLSDKLSSNVNILVQLNFLPSEDTTFTQLLFSSIFEYMKTPSVLLKNLPINFVYSLALSALTSSFEVQVSQKGRWVRLVRGLVFSEWAEMAASARRSRRLTTVGIIV